MAIALVNDSAPGQLSEAALADLPVKQKRRWQAEQTVVVERRDYSDTSIIRSAQDSWGKCREQVVAVHDFCSLLLD